MIYADHAATTRLERVAWEAMQPFWFDEYGNASQPYAHARVPKRALAEARETIAACLHAEPEEIFFTSGGTESDHWAIRGCLRDEGTRLWLVPSAFEHHALLAACEERRREGCSVCQVQPSEQGVVTPTCLEQVLFNCPEPACLVSVMLANNELGTVQPVAQLARVAHRYGALFHTDAVQAVGHLPLDVRALDVDLLSASGHKFGGPKGIGFLYVRRGTPLSPFLSGGAQELGMRAGTENVALAVGMAAALRHRWSSMEEDILQLKHLEETLLSCLRAADVTFIRNGTEPFLPGLLSLSFRGADGEALLHALDLQGICISTGAACDRRNTQISHVLRAIGLPELYARGTVRISLGQENTESDVRQIANALLRSLAACSL